MITIKNIIWINKDIGEADVIITDGVFEMRCFSQPFTQSIGEEVRDTISIFDYSYIGRHDSQDELVTRLKDGTYFFVGRLINKLDGAIQVGQFIIHDLPQIPDDIQEGEFIELVTDRVDLW